MKTYKHKLNMLEPGLKMVKMIGLFGGLSLVFHCINADLLCFLCGSLAVALGIILWILIMIEQHQDNVLNQQAINERKRNGED
jgi:hypothetical protein